MRYRGTGADKTVFPGFEFSAVGPSLLSGAAWERKRSLKRPENTKRQFGSECSLD